MEGEGIEILHAVAMVIWVFAAKDEQFAWFSKIVQVLSEISKGCRDGNQIWIHNQMDSCSVRKFASTLHPQKYSLSGGFARGWRYETNRCKYWTGQVRFTSLQNIRPEHVSDST